MKRKLHLEELAVEAFETTPESAEERGTVRAHDASPNCYSGWWSCIPDASCVDTCGMTCANSCWCTFPDTCNCA